MDPIQIAQMVGVGVAAFVASLVSQRSQIGRLLTEERSAVESQLGKLRTEGIELLQSKIQQLEKEKDALERRAKEAEDRLARCVTDEEFHAYVRTTTDAVHGLSEKVGRATGAIEAWHKMQRT